MPEGTGPVRFTDVLTMATSITNFLGEGLVEPKHAVLALDVLEGARSLESLGRPLSPLVRRAPGGPAVDDRLKLLVQQWWNDLGATPDAELTSAVRRRLRDALAALESTT